MLEKCSEELKNNIRLLLGTIGEREKTILENRILGERTQTLSEIGREFGVASARIHYQEKRLRSQIGILIWKERKNEASAVGQEYQRLLTEAIKERTDLSGERFQLYDIDYFGIVNSMIKGHSDSPNENHSR